MNGVDVVIPCYRYAHYLRDCVESVLTQEGVAVRVLILDDCSPDNTPEVADRLVREDRRVHYRRHVVNFGHISTYNEGLLGWTEAPYCLLLSADDRLVPGALRRATDLMHACPDMTFTYGKRVIIGEESEQAIPVRATGSWRAIDGGEFVSGICQTGDNPVCTPTAVVRTAAQRHVGGYRPELPHTGDLEMWLRLAAHGRVGVFDDVQACWRRHRENMRGQYRGVSTIRQHKAAFDMFFERDGMRLKEWESLSRQADTTLSGKCVQSASKCFDLADEQECKQLLNLALELDPGVRASRGWRRLQYKRALGVRAWSLLRPAARTALNALRRGRKAHPIAVAPAGADWHS